MSTKHFVRTIGAKGCGVTRLMIGAAVMLGLASSAMAAPPLNDEQSAATFVEAIPYTDMIDTTEATFASDDPGCYGQGPNVWYSFTPSETTFIGANTFGSNYDTTLAAYVEGVEGLVEIACNDDSPDTNQSRVDS